MMLHAGLAMALLAVTAICAGIPPPGPALPVVEMTIEGRGKVQIALYEKDAPKTVAHFLGLVKRKFYDGILFHRVRPGFVVQAGDPLTKKLKPADLEGKEDKNYAAMGIGDGGSGPDAKSENIPFEETKYAHEPGTIAMALNGPHTDTGDSQFFINLVPNHRLDGDYCVFAKVVKGMDVVKKIRQGDRIASIRLVKKP